MNIVDKLMLRQQWELENVEGYLTLAHGNYYKVIRRAAQMRYKLQQGDFVKYLWHYHEIEKQKHPAGRGEGIYSGYANYAIKYTTLKMCTTCTNSYNTAAFNACPVCTNQLLKE